MSDTYMPPSCGRSSSRGFTLIEVLVALSLLGLGLLSLAGGVTIVTRLVDRSRSAGRTGFVALGQVESLRHINLASPALCNGGTSGSLAVGSLNGSWTATPSGSSLSVVIRVSGRRGRVQATDTVSTALPC